MIYDDLGMSHHLFYHPHPHKPIDGQNWTYIGAEALPYFLFPGDAYHLYIAALGPNPNVNLHPFMSDSDMNG